MLLDIGLLRLSLRWSFAMAIVGATILAGEPARAVQKTSHTVAASFEADEGSALAVEGPIVHPVSLPASGCGCQSMSAPASEGHCFHERSLSCPGPHCRQLSCGHCGQRVPTCHPNGTTGSCVPESECRPVRVHEDWVRSEIMMQERDARLAADLAKSEAMVEQRKGRFVRDLTRTDAPLDCVPEGWDSPYYDATWFLGHAPTISVAIDPHRIDSAPAPGSKWYARPPFRKPNGIHSVLQR